MKSTRSENEFYSAVVCAAGSSSRMGGGVRKPYLRLRGKPILAWTLNALARLPNLKQIVLVTRREDRAAALAAARQAKLPRRVKIDTTDGGARRQDSVFNGLKATDPAASLVLVHDAARPFPEKNALVQVCKSAARTGAAILACRVRDTLKQELALPESSERGAKKLRVMITPALSSTLIAATVSRAGLWQAQTPQVFKRKLILECFEKLARTAPDKEMTDDAAVCEFFQHPVALVESSTTNFKVTQPEDLKIAEAFLKLGLVR